MQSTVPDYTLDQSDHYCVVSQLRLSCLSRPPVYVEARNIFGVDVATFRADLQARLHAFPLLSASQLHNLLSELLSFCVPPWEG